VSEKLQKYKCCQCDQTYHVVPGSGPDKSCPTCQSKRVEWLNYKVFMLPVDREGRLVYE
jgi:DNA-directed RNA polymerase subunit RPC12/RpoP